MKGWQRMAKEYLRMLRELDRSPPRRRAKNHTTLEALFKQVMYLIMNSSQDAQCSHRPGFPHKTRDHQCGEWAEPDLDHGQSACAHTQQLRLCSETRTESIIILFSAFSELPWLIRRLHPLSIRSLSPPSSNKESISLRKCAPPRKRKEEGGTVTHTISHYQFC